MVAVFIFSGIVFTREATNIQRLLNFSPILQTFRIDLDGIFNDGAAFVHFIVYIHLHHKIILSDKFRITNKEMSELRLCARYRDALFGLDSYLICKNSRAQSFVVP